MRELASLMLFLLLTAALLYGGLNLVELGMAGLLARECRDDVFSFHLDQQGGPLLVFAGRELRLPAGELRAALTEWWKRLQKRI
ncbi:MAG: hypothetical protein GX890_08815 [Firmicutes bacterium]|jgi:hypothetical protein|nr:hypothetical protein [Bacillota bacterium]HPU01619.1 hypothetical protein [Bacillota bacterium]